MNADSSNTQDGITVFTIGFAKKEGFKISMRYDGEPAERAVNYEQTHANSKDVPILRNIHISNVGCGHAAAAALIEGLPDQPIENLTMENISLMADRGFRAECVKGLALKRVNFVVAEGPLLELRHADEVSIS